MSDGRKEVTILDVLAQCALAMKQTANALLACVELAQQTGDVPEVVIEGSKEAEDALERIRNMGKRSRAVFGKKEPAGTPSADLPSQPQ